MKSFAKMLAVANKLNDTDLLVPHAERVELKRTRSGHFRLYVACGANVKYTVMPSVMQLVEEMGVTPNPFATAGTLKAVTFVDDDEANGDAPTV